MMNKLPNIKYKTYIFSVLLCFSVPLSSYPADAILIPNKIFTKPDSQKNSRRDESRQHKRDEYRSRDDNRYRYDRSRAQRHNKQHWDYRRDRPEYRDSPKHGNKTYRYDNHKYPKPRIIEKRVIINRNHHRPRYDIYRPKQYIYYRTPWYNTRYIAPIPRTYFSIGYRVNILPSSYIQLSVRGTPYYYYSGTYYKHNLTGGYVVVSAPVGAVVRSLPAGFIAFSLGLATYYYVNDTYYRWDEPRSAYVVVEKPHGATEAMETETTGRLFAYPNSQQSEELQARDRYECHQWAVKETGHDPSLETDELTEQDRHNYRRAISACLVGRDYTVK